MVLQRGTRSIAILATAAREIAPIGARLRLPGAAEFVTGVVNLRGTLVPLADPGRLLGTVPDITPLWCVALDLGGQRCALAVDALPVLRAADAPPGARLDGCRYLACEVVVAGASIPLLDVVALADDILLT